MARGGHTHICANTYRLSGQKYAPGLLKYNNLTQHTIALSFEWITPLCYHPPSMNNTLTTWHFLIKVPYLRKLGVIYEAENKGLNHFSSDENKGLKSITEIVTQL